MSHTPTPLHTPTPWLVDFDIEATFDGGTRTENVFELMSEDRANSPAYATSQSNAAFIVKACNAHDELVAALQDITDRFERICMDADGKVDRADTKRIKQARAALAKVQAPVNEQARAA